MAGGDGKRLRPITCTMPKPMVRLLNKPTIFYSLDLLKKHGIRDVYIALGYMGETIKKAVGDGSKWGLNISCSEPYKRLGTAGSVRFAVKDDSEPVLVLSGDGITDVDLTAAIKAHDKNNAFVTVVLSRVSEPSEYGVAVTDSGDCIARFIEKPSEREVFSDRANTGIYILSPEAIEKIPPDTEYDFSMELFPKLLSEGKKLLGYKSDSYWCDIGDISELRRAQADMLEGRCEFDTKAINKNGVYIEEGAAVSEDAVLTGPCYIGAGAEIGSGVTIGAYTVVESRAKLMEGANVKRSVIMESAVVRGFTELRGSVVCENADIDARSTLLEGSVIGAGTRLGKGVTVSPNVLIWPDKGVEDGMSCTENMVWGVQKPAETDGSAFVGYADRELTPAFALRIAAAFSGVLKTELPIGVAADGSAASVMMKQAVISGILSQGLDAVSSGAVSCSAFGYMIRNCALAGGIYIKCEQFERRVSIIIFDGNGTEADSRLMRSIKRAVTVTELKPTTSREIGVMRSVSSLGLEYEASILRHTNVKLLSGNPRKLIINASEPTADCIARIMLRQGWTVDTVSELKSLIPTHNSDAVSVLIDKEGNVSAFTASTGSLDRDRLLAVIALSLKPERAVLPSSMPDEITGFLSVRGIGTVSAPESPSDRRGTAMRENAYIPSLLEPEAAVIRLCELFCDGRLNKLNSELPRSIKTEAELEMDKTDFGRMLRTLVETEYDRVADMVDGVKLRYDTGWVTVCPNTVSNTLRVVAGSRDAEYSRELCDELISKLRKLNNSKK